MSVFCYELVLTYNLIRKKCFNSLALDISSTHIASSHIASSHIPLIMFSMKFLSQVSLKKLERKSERNQQVLPHSREAYPRIVQIKSPNKPLKKPQEATLKKSNNVRVY